MAVTRLHIVNMVLLAGAGFIILLLSLLTANSLTTKSAGFSTQQWKFYLGRDILPDNILYPILMIRDRLVHENTSPAEQVDLKLQYAEERYITSQSLLKYEELPLSISTLTKYQKYVISAGYQAINLDKPDKKQLETALIAAYTSLERTEGLSKEYPDYDLNIIHQLRDDTRILITQLEEKVAKM